MSFSKHDINRHAKMTTSAYPPISLIFHQREELLTEMLTVETIAKIRRFYHRDKKSIRQIAKDMNLARNTVRKIIRSDDTERNYKRKLHVLNWNLIRNT